MWRRILAVVVVAGAIAAAALAVLVRDGAPLVAVQTPRGCTPFRAEFRQLRNGSVEAVGRYARHHDGSTRRETASPGGALQFITIVNVPAGRFYSFAGGRWTGQLLRLTAGRLPPDGGADDGRFVSVSERVDGLRLVRETTATGAVLLRAPALNLFPVVEQHPDPAMRREHFNFVIEPVEDALFEPPPDAAVDDLPWPHVIGRGP